MPVVPNPGTPLPPGQTEAQIIQFLHIKFPGDLGNQLVQLYTTFARAHPHLSPAEAYDAWVINAIQTGLAKALGIALDKGGHLVVIAGTGAGEGLGQFSKDITTNPISVLIKALTSRDIILRLVEGGLGVALIIVGVSKVIAPNQSVLRTAAKVIK